MDDVIKIAICDDDLDTLENEVRILKLLCRDKGINAVIEQFISPATLSEKANDYSIVVLDIEMPETDGINLAKTISEKNPECYIMFITNYSIYLDRAFDVNAIRFLTKPVDKNRLSDGLDSILERISAKNKILYLTRRQDKLPINIQISSILYIENLGRHTKVVSTKYDEFEAAEVFSLIKNKIDSEVDYFCQSHQSYYVNLKYVVDYTNKRVILSYAGKTYEAELSRRKFKSFCDNMFRMAKKL